MGAHSLQVIPRVIGLAPADASRVLRQQGFAAQAPRPAGDARPAITEQLPSAGIAVGGPGGPVRVRLSTTPRPRAEPRAGRAPCTAATCVAAPRFDSAVGRGISAAGVTVDRGNAYVVDQPPTTCPEPDASQANVPNR